MYSFLDENEKIYNGQLELINKKTNELLSNINCSTEIKNFLKKAIIEIAYKNSLVSSKRSAYEILTVNTGKRKHVLRYELQKAFDNIVLDRRTRKVFEELGIQDKATGPKFLKAAAVKVEKEVNREKAKGNWLG